MGSPGQGQEHGPQSQRDQCESCPDSNLDCVFPGPETGATVLLLLTPTSIHSFRCSFRRWLEICVLFPIHSLVSVVIQLCICGFVHSFIHSFIHLTAILKYTISLLVHTYIHLFHYSFTYTFVQLIIHLYICSFIPLSFIHPCISLFCPLSV